MQPRATRYWLRFESGPRQGETVPLPEGELAVGRRSANQVVLQDGSVSGFHAELHVGAAGVEVVDLQSTNGTRVGAQKIERSALAHGDTVTFGSVEGTLVDEEFLGQPAAAAPSGTDASDLGGVSEQRLAQAGRRSKLSTILLVGALSGGAGALYVLQGGEGDVETTAAIEEVAGNRVGNGTFEGEEASAWRNAENAQEAFTVGRAFAATGRRGLGVQLASATAPDPDSADADVTVEGPAVPWAFARSPAVKLVAGRGLDLRATLASEGGTVGRVGLEFESSQGAVPAFIAWSTGVTESDQESTRTLQALVPSGYDTCSVVVAARGEGNFSVDDVVLLDGSAPAALGTSDDLSAHGYGPDGATVTVVRSGRVLFPAIGHDQWSASAAMGTEAITDASVTWSARAVDKGLALTPAGATGAATLDVRATVDAEGGDAGVLLASLGPDGYKPHASTFEVEELDHVLIGRGFELACIRLDAVASATGRVRDGVLTLAIDGLGSGTVELQSTFGDERARARTLQAEAEAADRAGRAGEALAHWQALLDEVPFEAEVVARAESERARLIQSGLERVEELRREVERARFFGLSDLFDLCRTGAAEVSRSFQGSEVALEADALVAEVDAALLALDSGREDADARRLRGVLRALGATDSATLRAHVQHALDEHSSGAGRAGSGREDHD